MRSLDETDLDILRLLLEDARRPYKDIADIVGVSPPTVSDRVQRLENLGVIRQFTLDIDRSKLNEGVGVLIEIQMRPDADDRVADRLAAADQVERVYETADARLVVNATVNEDMVRPMLKSAIDMGFVDEYDVRLLSEAIWRPQLQAPGVRIDYDEEADVSTPRVDTK